MNLMNRNYLYMWCMEGGEWQVGLRKSCGWSHARRRRLKRILSCKGLSINNHVCAPHTGENLSVVRRSFYSFIYFFNNHSNTFL
jgi:hypothetical protein